MRVDYASVLPEAPRAMLGLEQVVHQSSLDPRLVELVKLRVSQINGCARCVEMHAQDARALGVEQERLDLVAVWQEANCFTPAERAALRWCEALTLVAGHRVSDEVYREAANHFEPRHLVALTLAIVAINAWNRLNIGFEMPTGGYVSPHLASRQQGPSA